MLHFRLMISYNKYDFYQSNKKIFSTNINDALNDFIIKKSVHTNFEIKHISKQYLELYKLMTR